MTINIIIIISSSSTRSNIPTSWSLHSTSFSISTSKMVCPLVTFVCPWRSTQSWHMSLWHSRHFELASLLVLPRCLQISHSGNLGGFCLIRVSERPGIVVVVVIVVDVVDVVDLLINLLTLYININNINYSSNGLLITNLTRKQTIRLGLVEFVDYRIPDLRRMLNVERYSKVIIIFYNK